MASFFLLLSPLIFSLLFNLILADAKPPLKSPHQLVLPVTKDASTLQYFTQITQRTPPVTITLTVNLGGNFMWVDCEKGYVSKSYKPGICNSPMCRLSGSVTACGSECFSPPAPGCNNNTCSLLPYNPLIRTSTIGEVAADVVSVQSIEGRLVTVPELVFTCAPTSLLDGLVPGAKGMAGLGISNISFALQFGSYFRFSRKFALCLSSVVGKSGVIFVGEGSYLLPPDTNASTSLMYTPMIINPVSTAGASVVGEASSDYFIRVTSIAISGKPVKLNTTLLTIDKDGYGGTKISTVDPYMVMESSIYKAVTEAFVKEFLTRNVTQIKPAAPFKVCYDKKSFPFTWIGPEAPRIDMELHKKEVVWRILGSNSMIPVGSDKLCLGLINGGSNPRTAIVIGGHMLEDNILEFDMARKRIGFTSLLLWRQTACSNFKFASK
ncbi:Nepenthesin [Bertholletia excelsa]